MEQFGAGLGRECAAGSFVVDVCVCVFRHHLSCCKGIKSSPVLRTIHLYHYGVTGYCNLRR